MKTLEQIAPEDAVINAFRFSFQPMCPRAPEHGRSALAQGFRAKGRAEARACLIKINTIINYDIKTHGNTI